MTLTVGSLFSGIGGLELGLERAGMRVLWQVECDPYARRVLAKHWPDVERFEDVRGIGAHNLQRVDLICGGFPCQDISNAGKRAGISGERSGLWAEFARLVRELRPRYVLVENVSALLGRGMGRVLGDLAASGFDAEWDCIPAAAVGAPHRRDRLFLVAYPIGESGWSQPEPQSRGSGAAKPGDNGEDGALADANGRRREGERGGWLFDGQWAALRSHAHRCGGAPMGDTNHAGLEGQRDGHQLRRTEDGVEASGAGWWTTEPNVGRVAHGVPSRVDRLRCLGNAVVPQVAEFIGRRILAREAAR